jgi:hypothetical protein
MGRVQRSPPLAEGDRDRTYISLFAPADPPKTGTSADLAIAIGILVGSEQFVPRPAAEPGVKTRIRIVVPHTARPAAVERSA